MATITSTTILFNQLRTYCYNIEADSKKLRRNVEKSYSNNKSDLGASDADVQRFIGSLSKDVQSLHAKIDSVEELLSGPSEISHVTSGEVWRHTTFSLLLFVTHSLISHKNFSFSTSPLF